MTHMCVCIIVLFFSYSLPTRWKKLLQIFQLKEKKKDNNIIRVLCQKRILSIDHMF